VPVTAEYDASVDALYIRARNASPVAASRELNERLFADVDAHGTVVGVELLFAARRGIPTGDIREALGDAVSGEQEIADLALGALQAPREVA
jgi:uncharacterized protein YuzE